MKIVKTFEIEYDAKLGQDWLCLSNLVLCLTSRNFFLGPNTVERIEEISSRDVQIGVTRWKPFTEPDRLTAEALQGPSGDSIG